MDGYRRAIRGDCGDESHWVRSLELIEGAQTGQSQETAGPTPDPGAKRDHSAVYREDHGYSEFGRLR